MANLRSDRLSISKSVMDSVRSLFPSHIIDRIYNNCTLDKKDIVEIKIGVLLYNFLGFGAIILSTFQELHHPFDWIYGTLGVAFAILKLYSYFLDVRKKKRDFDKEGKTTVADKA